MASSLVSGTPAWLCSCLLDRTTISLASSSQVLPQVMTKPIAISKQLADLSRLASTHPHLGRLPLSVASCILAKMTRPVWPMMVGTHSGQWPQGAPCVFSSAVFAGFSGATDSLVSGACFENATLTSHELFKAAKECWLQNEGINLLSKSVCCHFIGEPPRNQKIACFHEFSEAGGVKSHKAGSASST